MRAIFLFTKKFLGGEAVDQLCERLRIISAISKHTSTQSTTPPKPVRRLVSLGERTRDGYEISPEQAVRWLERNDNNRNVNVAKVKKMAKDMREGHWDTTHQGVDGQHRLLAIVESGVTVRMSVTFNAAKSQHIDSGNIRSMANRVQMSDYDMSWTNNTILSAANLIGRVFAGSNLSHEEALSEWLMKYRTQIESATKCIKKATLPGLNSAGTTAAIIVAAMNDVPAIYKNQPGKPTTSVVG